jgi:hypothetical protein
VVPEGYQYTPAHRRIQRNNPQPSIHVVSARYAVERLGNYRCEKRTTVPASLHRCCCRHSHCPCACIAAVVGTLTAPVLASLLLSALSLPLCLHRCCCRHSHCPCACIAAVAGTLTAPVQRHA